MPKILLLSDNHGYVDDAIMAHSAWADEIWHAGDWLNMDLLMALEKEKITVRGVWGNADGMELRRIFPEHNKFTLEGVKFWMTHIGGYAGKINPSLKPELKMEMPNVFISGHSHMLRVGKDTAFGNMLCLNPGACGVQGFHQIRTALRFIVANGLVQNLEIIEFGPKTVRSGPAKS